MTYPINTFNGKIKDFFIKFIILLCLGYLFSGCSNSSDHAYCQQKEYLRIGTTMNIKRVNPLADYYYNILAMIMTHDSLVRFDPKLRVIPQLAERWSSFDGGKVWKFWLVSGARWHDGYPVTPEDVRFTFEYLAQKDVNFSWIADLIENIEINGREVIFYLKKPYSPFLINVGFIVRILPKHIWQKIEDPLRFRGKEATIGCGPYVFKTFNPRSGKICFEVNKNYYGKVPTISQINFYIYKNMDVLTMALLKNKIDTYYQYAVGYPFHYIERLKKSKDLEFLETMSMGVAAALGFNMTHRPFDQKKIREAIALAINYNKINQCVFGGIGQIPTRGFVPPLFPFWKKTDKLTYNPEQSKKLLLSVGLKDRDGDGVREFPNGKKWVISLLARADLWGEEQLVKLLVNDFKAIGLQSVVHSVDLSTWIFSLKEGKYDLVLFRTTPWGMMMHAGYASGYFDSRRKGGGVIGNLKDQKFWHLCDQIIITTNPSSLEKLYHSLQSYYAHHLPAVALCWNKNIYPFRKNWQGFVVHQLEGGLANRFSWRFLKYVEFQVREKSLGHFNEK